MPETGSATANAVIGFLESTRVEVHHRRIADGLGIVVADDDWNLVNTVVIYEPGASEVTSERLTSALSDAGVDPARSQLVVPDSSHENVADISRAARGAVRRVDCLSEYLDSFLRPMEICAELLNENDHATSERSKGKPLLSEDDFVDQWAKVAGGGQVGAIDYLFNQWATGTSPRLCMLLAPAGHGKSKITHILAKRLARSYQLAAPGQRPPVPILISFASFRRATSFAGLVLSKLDSGKGHNRLTIAAFQYLVSHGRVLFILDGYDEMVEANPDIARENIAEFVQNAGPNSRIILTSRSVFYRTSMDVAGEVGDPLLEESDIDLIDLQPFDLSQAKVYLRRRLEGGQVGSRTLERAQEVLASKDGLSVLSSPIFLSEFVDSIADQRWSITDVRRSGFVEYLIKRTFERERHRQGHDFSDSEQQAFLESIAFDMLASGEAGYERDDLEIFAAEAVNDAQLERQWAKLASHHFLLEVENSSRLISLRHQLWREHFQGVALGRRLVKGTVSLDAFTRDLPEGVLRACSSTMPAEWLMILFQTAGKSSDHVLRNMLSLALKHPSRVGGEPLPEPLTTAMSNRNLSTFTFEAVDFQKSNLSHSNLTGAYFVDCRLNEVDLTNALMNRTVFSECLLSAALLEADIASVTVNDELLFGPQVASLFLDPGTSESKVVRKAKRGPSEKLQLDFRAWATDVMRGRLDKFYKAAGGSDVQVVDQSISLTRFLGGLSPQHSDFVSRRMFKALASAGVIYQVTSVGTNNRPVVCLASDDELRREVRTFVSTGDVGQVLDTVLDKLCK